MATVFHQVSIDAPVARVYQAIATAEGIGTWWGRQTTRQTERGLVLEHNPGPEHGVVQLLVVALVPDRRIEWECISTHPVSSPACAWAGTHFIFELAAAGQADATTLEFRQTGYDEHGAFFGFNNFAWGQVLQNLKQVVEAQTKSPLPRPDLSARPFRAVVERNMRAAPAVLFSAWTQQIDRWFAVRGSVSMTPAVDAPYFFQTQHEGERLPHYGRFLRLVPEQLVELTWLTAGGTNGCETVVTVELASADTGTQLRLVHAGFPNEALAARHQAAWPDVLAELDRTFAPQGSTAD